MVERFKIGSVTEGLFTSKYKWTGVATVQVYSVETAELNDYDKTKVDGTSRFGTLVEVGDTVQEMTVTDDKSFNLSIDKGNNTAELMIKSASSVLRRETDEVIIPYVDKYRLKKLAEGAGDYTEFASITFDTKTAVQTLLKAAAAMSNKMVPKEGRVVYIGETDALSVKLDDKLVNIDKLGENSIVNGATGKIAGMQVKVVPDSYMPEGVVFLIVKKGVACAPKKIETYRILEEHPDIDGAVVQGRLLHDCFVLETQKDGILAAKKSA